MAKEGDFYIGKHRVSPCESGGYFVYPNDGARGRYYAQGSKTANAIQAGSGQIDPETGVRVNKFGTHEPVFYFRDGNGKVGIPPAGGLDLPEGCTLHEARSLQEIDSLTKEIQKDFNDSVHDDGMATRMFDMVLGDPIRQLEDAMRKAKSEIEKEVTGLLIRDLEAMESRNQESYGNMYFRERER